MTRVLLADDAALFRETLAQFLGAHGFTVVRQVGDATSLVRYAATDAPDLVIADVRMPPGNELDGLKAAIAIHRRHPSTAVLVLSAHVEAQHAAALFAGRPRGVGYLVKDRVAGMQEFVGALHRILAGGCVVDPLVVERMMRLRRQPTARLTTREHAVLELMAQGYSNAGIGDALALAPKTVESHITRIFTGLDLPIEAGHHRRVLAVLAYLDTQYA